MIFKARLKPWLFRISQLQLRCIHSQKLHRHTLYSLEYYNSFDYKSTSETDLTQLKLSDYFSQESHSYSQVDTKGSLKAGSFIEFQPIGSKTCEAGLIIKQPEPYYLSPQYLKVLKLDGTIETVNQEIVTFKLVDFLKPSLFENVIDDDDSEIISDSFKQVELQYILYKFVNYCTTLRQEMIASRTFKHLIRNQIALQYSQTSIQLIDLVKETINFPFKVEPLDILDVELKSPNAPPIALYLTFHIIIVNDPIHFRFQKIRNHPMATLEPLKFITSPYYVHPRCVSYTLENIMKIPTAYLISKYQKLLTTGSQYEIFQELTRQNLVFTQLINFIKVIIEFPHYILIEKVENLFPGMIIEPRNLYKIMVKFGLFTTSTNTALSSRLYGKIHNIAINSLNELDIPTLPKRKLNQLVNKSQLSSLVTEHEPLVYLITTYLGFSFVNKGFPEKEFSFYIPIPRRKIASSSINYPLNTNKTQHVPYMTRFKPKLKNQYCFKVSFIFNLLTFDTTIKEENLKPKLSFTSVDQMVYIPFPTLNSNSTITMDMNLDERLKVENVHNLHMILKLKEKEYKEKGAINNTLKNESLNGNEFEDYNWFINNTKKLVDQLLSIYCKNNNISIFSVFQGLKNPKISKDERSFYRFKIFKSISNSYDSFLEHAYRENSSVSLSNLISLTRYLTDPLLSITTPTPTHDSGFKPLGLTNGYSTFTNHEELENYINNYQLFTHLTSKKKKKNSKSLKINPVIISRIQNNRNSQLLLIYRLQRYKTLELLYNKMLKDDDEDLMFFNNSSFNFFKCIITAPPVSTSTYGVGLCEAYCLDLDIMVDIQVNNINDGNGSLMIGDRLICSEIVTVDHIKDEIILR